MALRPELPAPVASLCREILAGVDTEAKSISAATLHAALESFDEVLFRRTIIRTDINAGLVKNTPFYQIIPGRQVTGDERAADAYIKAGVSASPALISDILGWDEDAARYTITRQTEDPGYTVAQSNTGIWRRASGIRLAGRHRPAMVPGRGRWQLSLDGADHRHAGRVGHSRRRANRYR